MDSFRSGAKAVRLNVNDDGYCIELHVSNDAWLKRFLDFARNIDDKNSEHAKALKDNDDIDTHIEHMLAFDEEIKTEFEAMFGEGSYYEVFGSDIVGPEYIIEFLEACMPYIEKRAEQRMKALDKYSPSKTGGAK